MFYVWCLFIPGFKSMHGPITLYLAVNEMEHDYVVSVFVLHANAFLSVLRVERTEKRNEVAKRRRGKTMWNHLYLWALIISGPFWLLCQQQMNDTPLHAISIYFYYSFFLVFFFVFVFVFIFLLCVFVCRFAACSFIHRCQCRCHHPIARLIQLRRWLLTAFVRHKLGLTS